MASFQQSEHHIEQFFIDGDNSQDQNTAQPRVMLLKYPQDIEPQNLEFLKQLVKLYTDMWSYHDDANKKLQEIEQYFKFMTDDISGDEKRFYQLCEHKVFLRRQYDPTTNVEENEYDECGCIDSEWKYISDWCLNEYSEIVDSLLDEFYEVYKIDDEHVHWVKSLYHALMHENQFQKFTISDDNTVSRQSALSYFEAIFRKNQEEYEKQKEEHGFSDGDDDVPEWINVLGTLVNSGFNTF